MIDEEEEEYVKNLRQLAITVEISVGRALMKYMEKQDTEPMWKGYALAMTMFLVTVVKDILQTQFGQVTQRLLSHMTMVLREAVFKKVSGQQT